MPAKIDYESLALFGKFGGAMLGLLLLVWLIAILTPKAAALIDKLSGKPRPARVQDNIKPEEYEVQQAEPAPLSPPPSGDGTPNNIKPPQGGGENVVTPENYKVYSFFEDRPLQKQKAGDGEKQEDFS